jgi:hypothetical protein
MIPSFLEDSSQLAPHHQIIADVTKVERNKLKVIAENYSVKAKRGRPPSKPPTEELIRKQRKVC